MNKASIWIVDDEPAICWSLRRALETKGHSVLVFSNSESAIRELANKECPCDLLFTDLRLPGGDGFVLIEETRRMRGPLPVIMMTAFGDLETAVHAMKSEVFDYLTKPFDLHDALASVERALTESSANEIAQDFQHSIGESLLLGNSHAMQRVYKQIAMASRTKNPVLITGPEGSPCESVAAAIHKHSDDASLPFLPIAPTSISLTQLEREFTGFYSGAMVDSPRTGVLGLVGRGTLYIDEVADLTKSLQAQLYRVLEFENFVPFGSVESIPFEGRIIASSTRDMRELADQEEFDSRLGERLTAFTISIPPLSTRSEDTISIANAILRLRRDRAFVLNEGAESWLQKNSWPGDVRQLRNVLEHAMSVHSGGLIDESVLTQAFEQLQSKWKNARRDNTAENSTMALAIQQWLNEYLKQNNVSRDPPTGEEFGILYEEFLGVVEPPMIDALFRYLQCNRAATASKLGMHRSTLRQKMRRYGLD